MRILHLGCGRKGHTLPIEVPTDAQILSLDKDPTVNPDIVFRLGGAAMLPLDSDSIDLVVAWHVLEHVGDQGRTRLWFRCWEDLYRVLVPDGLVVFESPLWSSVWAWADPSHTRALSPQSFVFFSQDSYRIPGSGISPFRIRCDFRPTEPFTPVKDPTNPSEDVSFFRGKLRAVKPLVPWWLDAR